LLDNKAFLAIYTARIYMIQGAISVFRLADSIVKKLYAIHYKS